MITHAKTILKKNKKWTDRTVGHMLKAKLYRQNHTQKHRHAHSQKEKKGKIYIYIVAPKVHLLNFGMICCLFRYSPDAGYIKLLWRFNPLLLRLLGEISLSLLFAQLPGFSFGFGPASACRSPEGVCSHSDRMRLKEQLLRGLWLTQAGGGRGMDAG